MKRTGFIAGILISALLFFSHPLVLFTPFNLLLSLFPIAFPFFIFFSILCLILNLLLLLFPISADAAPSSRTWWAQGTRTLTTGCRKRQEAGGWEVADV